MLRGRGAPGAPNAALNGARNFAIARVESGFIITPRPPCPARLTAWPVGRAESVTGLPSFSPRHRTSDFSGCFVSSSSIQPPSSRASCGPPKHQPLPVVRSTPRPRSPARRTASPNAFIHSGERNFRTPGSSLTA